MSFFCVLGLKLSLNLYSKSERPNNAVLTPFSGRKEFVRESNWVFRSVFLSFWFWCVETNLYLVLL